METYLTPAGLVEVPADTTVLIPAGLIEGPEAESGSIIAQAAAQYINQVIQ